MSLFWTNPSALFWTSPTGLFWAPPVVNWTQTSVGGATGSFSSSAGIYTVTGTGAGVSGSSDSLYFVNQPATGNIEITAQVTNQTGTNPYAVSGLMISDSLSSTNPQCALIGVSPQNGVNFSYRTADGGTAQLDLGQSLTIPVWIKLVVSQTSVAGYSSLDGISWRLVGMSTMTLPSTYYVGFATSSNSSGSNTSTYSNLSLLTAVVQRSANLVSWLRADNGVLYNNSNQISFWTDQSSNGFNGSQSNLTSQPTLIANAANGLPALNFTSGGGGQFLQFPSGFDFTTGLSMFVILNPSSLSSGQTLLDFRNYIAGVSSDEFGLSEANTSGGLNFYAYAGGSSSNAYFASVLTANSYQLIEAIYDGVSSVSVYKNGMLIGTQGGLQTLANVSRGNNSIGESGNGGNYFNGQIAEILIFNTNLNSTDRSVVEAYLRGKYGL